VRRGRRPDRPAGRKSKFLLPHHHPPYHLPPEFRDAAIKVVGVGNVGTACWVFLFMAGDDDPLFLQIKEARASVLELFAGRSRFPSHGQRVVNGYRLMQPTTDVFLGWAKGLKRDYFVRQLRDIKTSIPVDALSRSEMDLCAT
jgi:hypothetical protein